MGRVSDENAQILKNILEKRNSIFIQSINEENKGTSKVRNFE